MNRYELAGNIRRLRVARRISQKKLAQLAGLSVLTIKNIESKKSEPRMRNLEFIAKALGVGLHELFRPVRLLKTVRFRSAKRMNKRENLLASVSLWLDDFRFLEDVLNDYVVNSLPVYRPPYSHESLPQLAADLRRVLGLSSGEPIYDMCGLLEHAGVKVLSIPSSCDGFFGLAIGADDGGPAIVVNTDAPITQERRIYSAAHELAHLVLHQSAFDVSIKDECEMEEKEANLFASHFLMPHGKFLKEWNEATGLHWVDRILKVKGIFRVSYKTVVFRLIDCGLADQTIWHKFACDYTARYGKRLAYKTEPQALPEPAFIEDRFMKLVRTAIEREEMTIGRGAELLRIGINEMRELVLNWK